MVGKKLSHYKILEELGRGGMGIVYKAEDTKLDRKVAIKVLPSAALASEDDRTRFYREAKAAAQLHHPHIASVFEIDEAVPSDAPHGTEPSPFIAMEFIEGKTLDAKIKEGPLKLEDAVRIASEIASALEAAHEKNIVHRDIKSQNVMLTSKGSAKVLDFGLAQTAQSTKLTRMGSTLGTIAYMSPEQARSEEVDLRTDLWSLGVVLYEMIAGKHPFPGDYEQAAVYSILNEDPEPLTALRTGVPMALEWLVNKCLAKKAVERYQSTKELIVDLKMVDLSDTSRLNTVSTSGTRNLDEDSSSAEVDTQKALRPAFVISGIVVFGVIAFLLGRSFDGAAESERDVPVLRTDMVLPEGQPLAFIGSVPLYYGQTALTLSRDGSLFAYVAELASGTTQLVVKRMDEYESRLLPETEGAYAPFFSPDGSQLGFFADDQLKVVPLSGGSSRALSDARNPRGGVWNTKDEIIFSDNDGSRLAKILVQGGSDETIIGDYTVHPGIIPDGENVLVSSDGILSIVSTSTGELTRLEIGSWANPISSPRYALSGHIIYMQGAQLMAVPFDIETLQTGGRPIPVIENVRAEALTQMGQYTISDNGILIYAPGGNVSLGHLVAATGSGADEILPFEPEIFGEMRLSPNGSQLALGVLGTTWDIWIYDLDKMSSPRRLTREGNNYNPVWTPDGRQIFFRSDRSGTCEIYSTSSVSSGDVTQLTTNDVEQWPNSISWNGEWLLYDQSNQASKVDIFALSLKGDSTIQTVAASIYSEWGGAFSPDGKHIAYLSDESGRYEIYVKSFSGGSERVQVSFNGGMDPIWSADGRSIYFNYVQDVYRVDINVDGELSSEIPTLLFSGEFIDLSGKGWAYDEARDRFILAKSVETDRVSTKLNVVSNWFEELKRIAPPSE